MSGVVSRRIAAHVEDDVVRAATASAASEPWSHGVCGKAGTITMIMIDAIRYYRANLRVLTLT